MAEEETALARVTPKQIEQAYRSIIDGDVLPDVGDPEVISRAIMERIMAAETFEETFAPQNLIAWRELLDVPVLVRDLHLNRSTVEGGTGPAVYAVVDLVVVKTGEIKTVTCGGRNVLIQLVKMLEKGWLDRAVKITQKRTGEGFNVLWLVPA